MKNIEKLIDNFTFIEIDEDAKSHIDLDLRFHYDFLSTIPRFDPEYGYKTLGKVDEIGHTYIDFGTFHSSGEPEAFILKNEENLIHPIIAKTYVIFQMFELMFTCQEIQDDINRLFKYLQ